VLTKEDGFNQDRFELLKSFATAAGGTALDEVGTNFIATFVLCRWTFLHFYQISSRVRFLLLALCRATCTTLSHTSTRPTTFY
jgi:hypothetical protein